MATKLALYTVGESSILNGVNLNASANAHDVISRLLSAIAQPGEHIVFTVHRVIEGNQD